MNARRNFAALLTTVAVSACAAPYQSSTGVDPMTGEPISEVAYVRLRPVDGNQSGQFLTGSADSLALTEVVTSADSIRFQVSHISTYGGGLVAAGQPSRCTEDTLRVSFDGNVIELVTTGLVQERGYVTQRSWGQATSGSQAVSQEFEFEGADLVRLAAARQVRVEYCNMVSEIDATSLHELKRGLAGTMAPGGQSASAFASACDARDAESCFVLGIAFASGTLGVQQNLDHGCRAFDAACEDGDARGCSAASAVCE